MSVLTSINVIFFIFYIGRLSMKDFIVYHGKKTCYQISCKLQINPGIERVDSNGRKLK